MKQKTKVISGLKWTAAARFGGQLLSWAVTIVVMRLLSPSDYGLMAMATVFLAFLLLVSEVGLGPALIQKDELDPEELRRAFGIVLIINLALLLLLNLFAGTIAGFFGDERLVAIIRALSLQFPVIALTVIPEAMLRRRMEFRNHSLIDFSSTMAGSLITLAFALAGFGVWSLVVGTVTGACWKVVVINCVSPYLRRPAFAWSGMKPLLSFGGNVTATRVLWFFYTQADTVIVGRLLGKEALGFYSVAMHLASLPMQRVSGILNQVAFPAFSKYQHNKEAVRAQLLRALGLLGFLAFPLLWGLSSTANEIVHVFLGPHWRVAVLPLQLLGLIMPLRMLASFLQTVGSALGRPQIALQNVIAGCIVMPLAFYVGSNWGIAGVAIAWVTAYPLVALIYIRRTLSLVGCGGSDLGRAIAPSMFAAAGMYLMVLAAGSILRNSDNRSVLFAKILVGVVTYTVLTLAVNRRSLRELGSLIANR